MLHRAIKIEYKKNASFELTFRTGEVKLLNMEKMFDTYPQLEALKDRKLFTSGKLSPGGYGVIWNEDLDIEAETIYEEGKLVRTVQVPPNLDVADSVLAARADAGLSQKELSERTGIDQADISKIERGIANPSVLTLKRLAAGLNRELIINFK